MVPNVAKIGHSFKGAMAYYLHDKQQDAAAARLDTAERVAWTETRNLATADPAAATRIMIATAKNADELKAAAGIKATGRKATAGTVLAYSLAWHPDKEAAPDRAEMLRAADLSLKAMKAEHLQAVIICHTDTAHPHVHIVVNRVDPANGKISTGDEWRQLSKFRNAYEKERGQKLTYSWQEKEAMKAQQTEGKTAAAPDQQTKKPLSKAGMLKEFQEQQKGQHGDQWRQLSNDNKTARTKIYAAFDERIAKAIAQHKAECRPIWAAYFREARARERNWQKMEAAGIAGKLVNAFNAAAYQKATGQDGGRGMLSLVFANTLSGQARQAIFVQRQELNRQAMAGKLKAVLAGELATLKDRRAAGLEKQRAAFDTARAKLIELQDAERAKIREAWRQIYSDRGIQPVARSAPIERRTGSSIKDVRDVAAKASPVYRRDVTPTRDQLLKGIQHKEELRRQTARPTPARPSYISRPGAVPAPRGEAPRPAQKTAEHLPAKELPPVAKPVDPGQVFKDAAARGIDQPSYFQNPSEIRAAYSKAGTSGLEEKRERSRSRGRTRTRTRSIKDDGNDHEI